MGIQNKKVAVLFNVLGFFHRQIVCLYLLAYVHSFRAEGGLLPAAYALKTACRIPMLMPVHAVFWALTDGILMTLRSFWHNLWFVLEYSVHKA